MEELKTAGSLISMKGMSQEDFDRMSDNVIERATTAKEKILCQLEKSGGNCPYCNQLFEMKHGTANNSDYYYYVAVCTCFEEKGKKLSPEMRGLIKSNIPLKYWEHDRYSIRFDLMRPETAAAFREGFRYCDESLYSAGELPRGAFLWGSVGSGKTLSSALIGKHFLNKGVRVDFFDMVRFYRAIIEKSDDRYFERAKSSKVIILDDLTKEVPRTDWGQARIHELVDILDKNRKIVIITDEKNPGSLGELFIPSVVSRLGGLTGCHVINFKGDDFRKKERDL
jgi:DNA replication protein DnaC